MDEYAQLCGRLSEIEVNARDLKQQTILLSRQSEEVVQSLFDDQISALSEECIDAEMFCRAVRTAFSYDNEKTDSACFSCDNGESIVASIQYCGKIFDGKADLQSTFSRLDNIPDKTTIQEVGYQMALEKLHKMPSFIKSPPKQKCLMILGVLVCKSLLSVGLKGFSSKQQKIILSMQRFVAADKTMVPLLEKTLLEKKLADPLCVDTTMELVVDLFYRACVDARLSEAEITALYAEFKIERPQKKWADEKTCVPVYADLDKITDTSAIKARACVLRDKKQQNRASKYGWELYIMGASMQMVLCLNDSACVQMLVGAWKAIEEPVVIVKTMKRNAAAVISPEIKGMVAATAKESRDKKFSALSLTFPVGKVHLAVREVQAVFSNCKLPAP